MAQTAQRLTEDQVPAGGIAEFIMSDAEIKALEKEENRDLADEAFGNKGIANFQEVAERMASYGRYGDDTVAHVETGELLVPRALIENNPKLKESIFSHLREMGVENPERYVVGSGENSINPETGLPEFFLKTVVRTVKKAVSGVAKGVSKVFQSVGKILKKVAPVVLPIVATMAFGPIYGAALGSGIGTLIQGGDLKDALKSALVSGAIGTVSAGVGSKLQGGTFVDGVKNAANTSNLTAGFESVGKAFGGDFSGFSTANMQGGPASKGGTAFTPEQVTQQAQQLSTPTYSPNAVDPGANMKLNSAGELVMAPTGDLSGVDQFAKGAPGYVDTSAAYSAPASYSAPTAAAPTAAAPTASYVQGAVDPGANLVLDPATQQLIPAGTEPTFFDTLKGYASKAGDMYDTYLSPSRDMGQKSMTQALAEVGATPQNATLAQVEMAKEIVSKSAPGLIQTYGPLAAVGLGATYLGGGFEAAPVEDPNLVQRNPDGSVTTGEDLIALNPDDYMVQGDPRYSSGQYTVATRFGLNPYAQQYRNPFARPQMYAAEGGEVYPRRNGGIMPNEGIPNQDSVRALLMPGEFVMTKDAVRGLGNGNLNQGINNMYSMMRNLETKGRAA